jgi:lysophospholipase L1-like esterase
MVFQGLKERFPTAVINCITTAIGGETSVEGARRFEQDVLPHRPDLLFIDYALNDRRVELENVEQAWHAMITAAKQRQIPVILLTPTGAEDAQLHDSTDPLNTRAELIRSLARQHNLPLADVYACWKHAIADGAAQNTLLSFINHPNRQGHMLAAREILRVLDDMQRSAS